MRLLHIILLTLGWFMSFRAGNGLEAQNQSPAIDQVVERVQAYFEKHSTFEVDIEYLLFNGHSSEELIEQSKGKMQRQGYYYVMDYGEVWMMQGEGGLLQADKRRRKAYLTPLDSAFVSPNPGSVAWENIKTLASEVRMIEQAEGFRIRISFEKSPFSPYRHFDVLIDKEMQQLRGYVMYFRQGLDAYNYQTNYTESPRLEVRFGPIKLDPSYKKGLFSLDAYVKQGRDGYRGLGALASYEIIDLTTPSKP